jgi:hypothetical protein
LGVAISTFTSDERRPNDDGVKISSRIDGDLHPSPDFNPLEIGEADANFSKAWRGSTRGDHTNLDTVQKHGVSDAGEGTFSGRF